MFEKVQKRLKSSRNYKITFVLYGTDVGQAKESSFSSQLASPMLRSRSPNKIVKRGLLHLICDRLEKARNGTHTLHRA